METGLLLLYYTKHHLKFGKNQADNLGYMRFRRRFFPVFYWCLVLYCLNGRGKGSIKADMNLNVTKEYAL